MKKIVLSMTFVVLMLAMAACGSSGGASSPEELAQKFVTAMQQGNFDEAIALMGEPDGTLIAPEKIKSNQGVKHMKMRHNWLTGNEFVVYDVKPQPRNDDLKGSTAKVKTSKNAIFTVSMVQGKDGKWRVWEVG